jgi:exopolysaccharide biosynthesis polyprenyl glycosylphosphotransferase
MKKNVIIKVFIDSIAYILTVHCALYFYHFIKSEVFNPSSPEILAGYTIYIFALYNSGGYLNHRELVRISDLVTSVRGALFANVFYVIFYFLLKIEYSRVISMSVVIILPIMTVFGRLTANYLSGKMKYLNNPENIIIYGAGTLGSEFEVLVKRIEPAYNILGYIDDTKTGEDILGTFQNIEEIIAEYQPSRLIVAIKELEDGNISEIVSKTNHLKVKVSYISSPALMRNNNLKFRDFAGITMVTNHRQNNDLMYLILKRIIDIIVSSVGLIITAPLWILLFFLSKYKDKGPLLFSQERIGMNSKAFRIYKFRSMYTNTNAYDHCPVDSSDPRITPIGKYLRKYSIDELPQLFNVLKGDMSLVGPRPEMPFIVEKYNSFEKQRLKIKSGITGLWQISPGRKHEITDNLEYDIYYLENQSLTLDAIILILTGVFVIKSFTH